jgi:hypothetical protein
MMEAIYFTETAVLTRARRRNIPEDGILQSHSRENLKSYKLDLFSQTKINMSMLLFRIPGCESSGPHNAHILVCTNTTYTISSSQISNAWDKDVTRKATLGHSSCTNSLHASSLGNGNLIRLILGLVGWQHCEIKFPKTCEWPLFYRRNLRTSAWIAVPMSSGIASPDINLGRIRSPGVVPCKSELLHCAGTTVDFCAVLEVKMEWECGERAFRLAETGMMVGGSYWLAGRNVHDIKRSGSAMNDVAYAYQQQKSVGSIWNHLLHVCDACVIFPTFICVRLLQRRYVDNGWHTGPTLWGLTLYMIQQGNLMLNLNIKCN